ncbi:MAG: Na+/H+ antiporter NhaC family protein [Treponemataceae bacterium]
MINTFWSLVPAIIAIVLALITKEVYSSLFIGILIGAVFFACFATGGFTFSGFLTQLFDDGLIKQLSNSYNVGILIFLVILGIMVSLMNKAGGSAAFGRWAQKHIKTKVGAQCATIILGMLIFIDDYFNCLTVGSVMKPVTEKYGVSREKLAYLIDATAAPICIIAPISSWAAAVSGFVTEGENGIALFCRAIPFNFYALFILIMLFSMVFMKFEFGPMAKYEKISLKSDCENKCENENKANTEIEENPKGKVIDLLFPVIVLITFSVLGMIYSGGIFNKESDSFGKFIQAFANSDASVGLVIGSFATLIISIIYFCFRRVLKFRECMSCIPEGFKSMVPAILILSFAWTLKGMTDSLGAAEYVANLVSNSAENLQFFLPSIVFVIAVFLAFATGTSWGTFGILIPICISVFPEATDPLRIISMSACMAGAVCGDHFSPISDTTIMASAGAQCNHVNHVNTQLPYAVTIAIISFISYVVAGFTQKWGIVSSFMISFIFGLVCLFVFLIFMKRIINKKGENK